MIETAKAIGQAFSYAEGKKNAGKSAFQDIMNSISETYTYGKESEKLTINSMKNFDSLKSDLYEIQKTFDEFNLRLNLFHSFLNETTKAIQEIQRISV
jgi:hypothetical protein